MNRLETPRRERWPRVTLSLIATMFLASAGAAGAAGPIYIAVDVPTRLHKVDYTPDQIVRDDRNGYSLEAQLPPHTAIGALHRFPDGAWLFAPQDPVTLDLVDYEPRDLVEWDGQTFAPWLTGAQIGIPAGVRIDALFIDNGSPVISFDTPVQLDGTFHGRSDLVRWDAQQGGFSTYWNAAQAGVPAEADLVGADERRPGTLVLAFEQPTDLGQQTYENGQLVEWSANGFSAFDENPFWPPSSRLRGLDLAPLSGAVPASGSAPLRVSKGPNGELILEWDASCNPGDGDYEVYEGPIGGTFTDHTPVFCSTGGATQATLTPGQGDRYFLVTPRNALTEGSYGVSSAGIERPASAQACLPQATGACE